jgi:hypothetical protein
MLLTDALLMRWMDRLLPRFRTSRRGQPLSCANPDEGQSFAAPPGIRTAKNIDLMPQKEALNRESEPRPHARRQCCIQQSQDRDHDGDRYTIRSQVVSLVVDLSFGRDRSALARMGFSAATGHQSRWAVQTLPGWRCRRLARHSCCYLGLTSTLQRFVNLPAQSYCPVPVTASCKKTVCASFRGFERTFRP